MKFKYTNEKTFKTVGKIKEILLKYTKNGSELIVLAMQDGRIFTNFKKIWDKIGIDIDSINEGDELEIEYSIYIYYKNCTKYLNFWNIVHKLKIGDFAPYRTSILRKEQINEHSSKSDLQTKRSLEMAR